MRMLRSALLVAGLAVMATPVSAAPITFEDLSDLESVNSQFSALGVTFDGAVVLTSGALGGSLNEFEWAPESGSNVVTELSTDGIEVTFADGASTAGGYFRHSSALTLTAFGVSGSLGSLTSTVNNLLFSGNQSPTGEFLELGGFSEAITRLIITHELSADGLGGYTLDDFSFEAAEPGGGGTDPNPVPEPATVSLVLLGAAVAAGRQKLRARRRATV